MSDTRFWRRIRVERWRHPDLRAHVDCWLQGWCEIADGLTTVLSLGFLISNLELTQAFRRGYLQLMRVKKKYADASKWG